MSRDSADWFFCYIKINGHNGQVGEMRPRTGNICAMHLVTIKIIKLYIIRSDTGIDLQD